MKESRKKKKEKQKQKEKEMQKEKQTGAGANGGSGIGSGDGSSNGGGGGGGMPAAAVGKSGSGSASAGGGGGGWSPRDLFKRIVDAKVNLVVHNGFLDLASETATTHPYHTIVLEKDATELLCCAANGMPGFPPAWNRTRKGNRGVPFVRSLF